MSKKHAETLVENRRARFDYETLATYEAGLELTGQEVKSLRNGRANLGGSYGLIRGGEAWLLNCDIPAYQAKNAPPDYESGRTRRLLLRRAEIRELTGKLAEKGLSLIPLRIYSVRDLVKAELILGRSRKAHDKRAVVKKREAVREIRRALD